MDKGSAGLKQQPIRPARARTQPHTDTKIGKSGRRTKRSAADVARNSPASGKQEYSQLAVIVYYIQAPHLTAPPHVLPCPIPSTSRTRDFHAPASCGTIFCFRKKSGGSDSKFCYLRSGKQQSTTRNDEGHGFRQCGRIDSAIR